MIMKIEYQGTGAIKDPEYQSVLSRLANLESQVIKMRCDAAASVNFDNEFYKAGDHAIHNAIQWVLDNNKHISVDAFATQLSQKLGKKCTTHDMINIIRRDDWLVLGNDNTVSIR